MQSRGLPHKHAYGNKKGKKEKTFASAARGCKMTESTLDARIVRGWKGLPKITGSSPSALPALQGASILVLEEQACWERWLGSEATA